MLVLGCYNRNDLIGCRLIIFDARVTEATDRVKANSPPNNSDELKVSAALTRLCSSCSPLQITTMPAAPVRRCIVQNRRLLPHARAFASHATQPRPLLEKNCASITPPYAQLLDNLATVRSVIGKKPLTLAEKILYSHIFNPEDTLVDGKLVRGETYLQLSPERVAMQDASAQYVFNARFSGML